MNRRFRIADVELDATRGLVRRGASVVSLRQQALEVLLHLMRNADRVVSKEELFATVWNETAVTDDAVVQCVVEIRKALGDDARAPRFIRTVPKVGYRFLATVEPLDDVVPESADDASVEDRSPVTPPPDRVPGTSRPPKRWRITLIPAAVAATIIAAAALAGVQRRGGSADAVSPRLDAAPGLRRVAVASFSDNTGSPDLAWLRRGLPDMLVTSLSQVEGVAVLGRQSFELLLARDGLNGGDEARLDHALHAARRGNAEYVLLGSFARLGTPIRIEVRVHAVATGSLLISDSAVAVKPEELLIETDALAGRILTALHGRRRSRSGVVDVMTDSLEAYRCYVIGLDKAQAMQSGEAIEWLQKAVAADPQFAAAHARLGYTYAMVSGEMSAARPHLERAFKLSERLTDRDRANIAAWYSVVHGDFPAAIDAYRSLLDRYPEDVEAYWRLGALLAGEERFDDAIATFERGLALDPTYPQLLNGLHNAHLSRRDFPRAIELARRYVDQAPDRPNAYDSLGTAYYAAGDYERAMANFNRALELSPTFEIAEVHRGTLFYRLGRYRDALRSYDRYIAIATSDGTRARGHSYKAWIEYRRGNTGAAWRELEMATKLGDTPATGIVIALEQKRAVADEWYKRLTSQVWAGRGARNARSLRASLDGHVALRHGRVDEALRHFADAVNAGAVYWHIEDFDDALADGYARAGRLDAAITEYERVLARTPNRPITRFRFAQVLERAGHRGRAAEAYRAFLDAWRHADGDVPELRMARDRLAALATPH